MPDTNETSGLSEFLVEMRRRHVGRFALGYAAAAFVILQLAEIVFPAFGVGEDGLRILVTVAALGFPPSLVLAWVYDISREGITRTEGGASGPWLRALALGSLLIVTLLATGGAGLYLARQGVFETSAERSTPTLSAIRTAGFDPEEPINSLAVLPLADYSPGDNQAYFAASMHEELIAKLSQIDQIRVVSRTSVMRYADTDLSIPEIGRELDVDVVVEGSVARTAERTRVTLQLIHAPSDTHIRTLQWDREQIDDVLAFQTEVAHEVVEEVSARHDESVFTTVASDVDPEAQDAYFRGRYEYGLGTADGYRKALQYFEEAVAEDPDFANAMAGMAGARFLGTLESDAMSEEALMRAYEEAETALALDSTSVETREVFELIERSLPKLMGTPADVPGAPPEARTVRVVRRPGSSDSIVVDATALDTAWVTPLTTLGERIEAQVRRHTENTGQEAASRMVFDARQLLGSGRYAEAETVLETALELNPDASAAWDMLVRAHVARGDADGALEVVRRWVDAGTEDGPDEIDERQLQAALSVEGTSGYWSWRLERLDEAQREGRPVPSFELASTHAALGNDEEALDHLMDALEDGEPGIMSIRTDPVWDDLRADPRLREIVRQAQRLRFAPDRRRRPGG